MLKPNYIKRITRGVERLAFDLETEIIAKLCKRLIERVNDGDFMLSSTDKRLIKTVERSGVLLKDIQEDIAKYTGLTKAEVRELFETSAAESDKYDAEVYQKAGISIKPLAQSPEIIRLLQRNYEATLGEFINLTRTTADSTQKLFIKACDTAHNLVASGGVTLNEAVAEVITDLANKGIQNITYSKNKDGQIHKHVDTLETATLRAVRTSLVQSTAEVTLQRLKENDWDVVLVSAHLGARCKGDGVENHAKWQGKFYSLKGEKYPDFYKETGYGTGEGLCGWNCRHSFAPAMPPFNPFKDIDSEANRKAYELSQEMRAKERAVRREKRLFEILTESYKADPNNAQIGAKINVTKARLTAMNREFELWLKTNNLTSSELRRKSGIQI